MGLNRCRCVRYNKALRMIQDRNDGIPLARVVAVDTERNRHISDILRGDINKAGARVGSGGNTGKHCIYNY